jgi:hypothetical protein
MGFWIMHKDLKLPSSPNLPDLSLDFGRCLGNFCILPWAEAACYAKKMAALPKAKIQARPGLSVPIAPERYQLWEPRNLAKSKPKPAGFGIINYTDRKGITRGRKI